MSDESNALPGHGNRTDGEMSLRPPVVEDAISGSQGLVEVFAVEAQRSQSQVRVVDDSAGEAGPAFESSAPATLHEAARALMNV